MLVEELASGANFMTSAGVDHEPTGLDPKAAMVERSVPKEVYKDAILAWDMNRCTITEFSWWSIKNDYSRILWN
jgi:hypothetical protein